MKIREILSESLAKVVDSNYIYSLAKNIHHTPEDFEEGDLSDRIFWFDLYKLVNLPMKDIDISEWNVDDDRVDDYVNRISKSSETIPPIIYDPFSHSIIDGSHRANAYHKIGLTNIPAYVGSVKSDTYGEHSNNDDDY